MSGILVKDGQLTEHFSIKEATVENKGNLTFTAEQFKKIQKHANCLEEFRVWYNKPIRVTSWIRSAELNKACGGVQNSNHLRGFATDLAIKCDATEFKRLAKKWKAICKKHKVVGEAGHYPNDGFIHLGSQITYSKSFYNWRTDAKGQHNMFYKI